jgi:hypothetical protein
MEDVVETEIDYNLPMEVIDELIEETKKELNITKTREEYIVESQKFISEFIKLLNK